MLWITLFLSLTFLTCCKAQPAPIVTTVHESLPVYNFQYNINEPDTTFRMPSSLVEISGIALSTDGSKILAQNDEDGTVFILDKHSGELLQKHPFGNSGDYEDIEVFGDRVFVVKSNSNIYEIIQMGTPEQEVVKHSSFLTKDYDVEGLSYDPRTNSLLLACKGIAGEAPLYEGQKAIYRFRLDSKEMDPVPPYLINMEAISQFLEQRPDLDRIEKLTDFFDPESGERGFSPSAIAIHPISGHFYITSSVGKVLVIMDQGGIIQHVEKLDKSVHPQPEGLLFEADGTLYISSEGKKSYGRIHRYRYNSDKK